MLESNPITASYNLTIAEQKAAHAADQAKPRSEKITQGVITIVLLGIATWIVVARTGRALATLDFTFVAVVVAAVLLAFYWRNSLLKKAFAQNPGANRRIEYTFSPDSITSRQEGVFETKFQWNSITLVKRTRGGFLFYQSPQIYFWVPEHAFQSKADADRLTVLASSNVQRYIEI